LRGEGEVEVCDVGLVMFCVVEGHDLGTDVGLECLEGGSVGNGGRMGVAILHHRRRGAQGECIVLKPWLGFNF
jgi:hypothetical protein